MAVARLPTATNLRYPNGAKRLNGVEKVVIVGAISRIFSPAEGMLVSRFVDAEVAWTL
jgi:hypothetical protein